MPPFEPLVRRTILLRDSRYYLTDDQIARVLDRLVPQIAAPEDHEFFRGALRVKAESSFSSEFAALVAELLRRVAEGPGGPLPRDAVHGAP